MMSAGFSIATMMPHGSRFGGCAAEKRAATMIFSHVLPKWMMWMPSTVRRKT